MKRAVKGLDHVVVMVDGIDAAQRAYQKLGFQVQPRGFHNKLGTANHLMIFDKDYFEILGIVEDTPFNAERREWLKEGDRKSTRLNSSHQIISYAVFCLKKKKKEQTQHASIVDIK